MKLELKLTSANIHPVRAIIIKGSVVSTWLNEIERMELVVSGIKLYPLPDIIPNSIYGCLIISSQVVNADVGKNERMQCVNGQIYIPEKTEIYPRVERDELVELLRSKLYCFHPVVGFFELAEELALSDCMTLPDFRKVEITIPESYKNSPTHVKSFEIIPIDREEVIKNMDEKIFPKTEKMKDDSLSIFEKLKLYVYRQLFNTKKVNGKISADKKPVLNIIDKIRNFLSPSAILLSDEMKMELEELEKRNQSEVEKLISLFGSNTDEALKYAIPLDSLGSSRGSQEGLFTLSRRWQSFSLFQQTGSRGGKNVAFNNDTYVQLQSQYRKTAAALIREEEFEKAAFIYLKLLKSPLEAGATLHQGKLYQEAATIFLKYGNMKAKAAESYEAGKMYSEAIALYTELNKNEKVGDLYMQLNKRGEANIFYYKVVNDFLGAGKNIKAADLLKTKMDNLQEAQMVLKKGWDENKDAYNCLSFYLENIKNNAEINSELHQIFDNELTELNRPVFIRVLKDVFNKHEPLKEPVKEMAYQIIAASIRSRPEMADLIRHFENRDPELNKDIVKWKIGKARI